MTDAELADAAEFIKDRLYFTSCRAPPTRPAADHHFFSVDNNLVYEGFFDDFGPLNLAMLYRFCCHLADKLQDKALANKKIIYYTSHDPHKRANGAYLMTAFAIIHLKRSAEEAYMPIMGMRPTFAPYKDVYGGSWDCTIIDCCRAVDKAQKLGWLNFESNFNVQEYEHYERVENGDLCVIVPGRFVAFSGPARERNGYQLGPEEYVPILKHYEVTAVVRLNTKKYDRKKFLDAGIKHYDMYFTDGGNPTEEILQNYIEVVEQEKGAVGIHCKAGLGRTGVLNGAYLMKHYRITANELIAWMRICRPGTVIGPQQQFLKEIEKKMWQEGDAWRRQHGNQPPQAGPSLPPVPEGWYDQPDSRCDQDDELCAANGGPTQRGALGGVGAGGPRGVAARTAAPSDPRRFPTVAAGGAAREAPTRSSTYGSTMAGRSSIGTSAYGRSNTTSAYGSTAGAVHGRRAVPAPAAAPRGGYGGSVTGSRYGYR